MKLITIFKIVLVVFVITASFLAGKELQKRNNMKDFAEYEGRINKLIKVNTVVIEGQKHLQNKLDQKSYELEFAKAEYNKLKTTLANSYQDPNIPDAPVDELIIFTPDISEPEIVEIIKEVKVDIVDETIYPYRDKINGYNFDLNVRYVSKQGLFFFEPEKLNITPQKQDTKRNSTVSIHWFGKTDGLVQFQHEIFEWLPIGFEGGTINNEFIVGVNVGFRF